MSFVLRDGRHSQRLEHAWDADRAHFSVEPERGVRTTSIASGWVFDAEAAFGRRAPLVVEIGSGDGDAILASAAARPDENFLAVEVYRTGLAHTILAAEEQGLTNLRVMQADAMDLISHAVPAGSVSDLRVFFPDPWHKQKHHKRRLVAPAFVDVAAEVLEPGGLLRLATDWQEYADQMVSVCDGCEGLERAQPDAAWTDRGDRIETKFERKGLAKGRTITDLVYVRRPARR